MGLTISISGYDSLDQYKEDNNDWYHFILQDCNYRRLLIFNNEDSGNQNVKLDIKIQNLTGVRLFVSNRRLLESGVGLIGADEITAIGITTFEFDVVQLRLFIESPLQDEIVHQIEATGQYRINDGSWNEFTITRCYPVTIELFSNTTFLHELLIEVNVTSMSISLIFEYAEGDVSYDEEIEQVGNYSYRLNTSYVLLTTSQNEVGTIEGYYRITSFGFWPIRPQFTGLSSFPILFTLISIVMLRKKFRKYK